MFDSIPVPVAFILESESVSTAGVFQRCCAINEKHSIIDVVFLAKIRENEQRLRSCALVQALYEVIRLFWIESSIQPVLLVVESDHSFVDRDVIGIPSSLGL